MVNEGFRKYKMLTKVDASINLLNILLIDPMHFAFPQYGPPRIDPWLNLVMQNIGDTTKYYSCIHCCNGIAILIKSNQINNLPGNNADIYCYLCRIITDPISSYPVSRSLAKGSCDLQRS